MYQNIRGLKSKLDSLMEKLEEVEPTLFCITETHLLEKEGLKIEGYELYRNDRDNFGGGILIGVRIELEGVCTIVEKSKDVGEMLWVAIDNNRVKLRIGAVYAPQESRTSKERLKQMYEKVGEQVLKAKEKQQSTVILGDLNCKIGDVIKGNRPEVTKGGKLLLKFVKNNDLLILNQSEKCRGLWTRCEGISTSVLDYFIIDNESSTAFETMLIDEEREFSPASYDQNVITYSDHNIMIAKFNWIVMEAEKEKAKKREVITTKGYVKFAKELKEEKVADIFKNDGDCQLQYEQWKNKVQTIAKRNTTTIKKKNPRKIIKELVRRKRDQKKALKDSGNNDKKTLLLQLKAINEQIRIEREKQSHDKLQKVVHKIKCKKGINGPNMWEVLKSIRRRKVETATAIKNKDGIILEDTEEIKSRYLEHFVEILQPPQASTEEERKQEEVIDLIFQNIMKLAESMEPQLTTIDEVVMAKKQLKRKKCRDPYGWVNEMVIEGGEEMDQSLLFLFNRMEKERFTPKQWQEVTIKTIAKPGSILEMDNKRGLFLTEVVSKLYEKVLKNRNKDKIKEYISDFQNGGVENRSIGDKLTASHRIFK